MLKHTSKVDHHNSALGFTWSLGPASGPSVVEGVDFCALAPNGRLASMVGFIDKAPMGSDIGGPVRLYSKIKTQETFSTPLGGCS